MYKLHKRWNKSQETRKPARLLIFVVYGSVIIRLKSKLKLVGVRVIILTGLFVFENNTLHGLREKG
ncbi:hypothetical protein SpAn4DRAFT_0367 [Sporomusa ovata]|uniref:Uncharacterized protein n=1 Tax=Sporomusa ovata TaxID=2378 RepID=A0A0U1L310_9FIRM|nr:hypothetical protein [Sporomusa ovata]CQR73905.1 hypothetical protein SpAn4DRAFT_0367 [Sporomusa ovata]